MMNLIRKRIKKNTQKMKMKIMKKMQKMKIKKEGYLKWQNKRESVIEKMNSKIN